MTKRFDKKIKDAQFEIQPSDGFVDGVMKQVNPPRWSWLRPYALALPLFVIILMAIPVTREAVLEQMYPERAVAASIDDELNEISALLEELSTDFDDTQLENIDQQQ